MWSPRSNAGCVLASRRSISERHALGWKLLAASASSWCLGQVVWTFYEVSGAAAPFPLFADVGYLLAHTSGLILNVEVDEDHQGEGIARALYEHADQAQGLYHVPAWGRTDDGEGFATAMGGDTMDDDEAAAILDVDLSFLYDNAA